MMGLFGWSLPPGVSTLPGEGDDSCPMCGVDPDACQCPVCPTCGNTGDPRCYREHNMKMTPIQIETERQWAADNAAQAKAEAEMDKWLEE